MNRRLLLQTKLEEILGNRNVYFQKPSNLKMEYPCIRYEWDSQSSKYANDVLYAKRKRYKITVIDPDPDSTIHEALELLPLCSGPTRYTSNNLNHTVYTLYF
jgi:hypothetical protein